MTYLKCCGLLLLAACGSTPDPYVGTWDLVLDPTGGTCNNSAEWHDRAVITGPPYYVTTTGDTAGTAAGDTATASASSSGLRWVVNDSGSTYEFQMGTNGAGTMSENRAIPGANNCTETWALTGTKY